MTIVNNIQTKLRELSDESYAKFQRSLVPNIDPATVLGVRVPDIRRLAKSLTEGERRDFMQELPHEYYDENMLHAAVLCLIKDFDEAVMELDRFLNHVDNWAVCDCINPKAFSKNHEKLLSEIRRWMASNMPYAVRFGIGILMRHFLDEDFRPEYLHEVAAIRHEEYYVKMMQAWFMATALAKQYEETLKIIRSGELDPWVQNKSIQKARESFRVPLEHKNYLSTLKI